MTGPVIREIEHPDQLLEGCWYEVVRRTKATFRGTFVSMATSRCGILEVTLAGRHGRELPFLWPSAKQIRELKELCGVDE